jgi:hypothetical protein
MICSSGGLFHDCDPSSQFHNDWDLCEISSSYGGEYEDDSLLGISLLNTYQLIIKGKI